jgi:C-22 sterol desaturase
VLTGRFVVIASTRDMARKVFNSPMFVKPCVVDVAHKLLRPENWVFLDGKAHVDYRKGLNGLFTRQALESYLPGQEEVYDKYFAKFLAVTDQADGAARPFMTVFRELMCAVSCRVFVGRYSSDAAVLQIATDYYHITAALELVNFPIILPFTRPWYGKKAADMVLREFSSCAAKSKLRMAAGGEPDCILDRWVMSMLESKAYREKLEAAGGAGAEGVPEKPAMLIRWFSDLEIAMTLLTFLFASQDATTSACTWIFQLMADRPEWLEKVREENMKLCGGDVHAPLTMDMLDGMVVTKAVVKETLRYRPPVLMVPYVAKKAFPITPDYTVPKGESLRCFRWWLTGPGSMVVPTTYPALHDPEAYPNPDSFDPQRWITGDAEDQHKNWLVFGTGPHVCIGQTYATLHLMAMLGRASLRLDWRHEVTDLSEEINIFATIFPKVSSSPAIGQGWTDEMQRITACCLSRRGRRRRTVGPQTE